MRMTLAACAQAIEPLTPALICPVTPAHPPAGAIPASYRRLRRLVGLDVGSNRLGGPLPSLTALPLSLTALNLRDNLFTGTAAPRLPTEPLPVYACRAR